ncbi:putative Glycosyltransferase [Cocos nucifera]|nr:putative Glycosyltransferase [Cocos nucifera]
MHPTSPIATASSPPDASDAVRCCLTALLVLAVVAVPSAVLYRAASLFVPRPPSGRWDPAPALVIPDIDEPIYSVDLDSEGVRLDRVLKEAAMEDKTVILTTLNAAWASSGSIIDLFIESFRLGDGTRKLLNHLVIIALDRKAYMRCMFIHFHCFALITDGVDFSAEKRFMTAGYLNMMWRRIEFLGVVLEKGYNFIFSVHYLLSCV